MLKHVWFDLEGTLTVRSGTFNRSHDELRYSTYANVTKKPLTDNLKQEYEGLYSRYGSNSAVFRSLGFPSDFWQRQFNTLDKSRLYGPQPEVAQTLKALKKIVPISIFTNMMPDEIAKTLALIKIERPWFTFVLSGDEVQERKPALDGFYEIVQRSNLPPDQILYVGDRVDVDILPANKVGLKTCLVWGKSDIADYSFRNFEDILSLFADRT